MMKRTAPIALAIALSCCGAIAAASVRPGALPGHSDPDWPCIQRKVPELSVVAVWTGPPVEEALTRWQEDPEVAAMVEQVVSRRMPLDEAVAAVSDFAKSLPPERKAERLTLLFAGIFARLDSERSEVMEGIERYARKQRDMAEQIRADMALAGDASVTADQQAAQELQNRILWQTRIFNERRASLTFVCEVPTIIEQRLFALGRAIASELPT